MSRRIRSLKPELIEDEKVGPLSDTAFRLFASLITLADDHGNCRAEPRWLQAQIWWGHESPPNVLSALIELWKAGLIEPYGVRGGAYCHIRGWGKHQRIDNAGKHKVPPRNDPDAKEIETTGSGDWHLSPRNSASLRESGSQLPGSPLDMDRKGEEGDGRGKGYSASPTARGKAKARLPADWAPSRSEANLEAERVATARGVDIGEQLKNLRDWAASNNSKKADWDATWRNWTRNAKPSGPYRGTKTPLELQLERVQRLEAEERAEGASDDKA
jgi:hypothetical protein